MCLGETAGHARHDAARRVSPHLSIAHAIHVNRKPDAVLTLSGIRAQRAVNLKGRRRPLVGDGRIERLPKRRAEGSRARNGTMRTRGARQRADQQRVPDADGHGRDGQRQGAHRDGTGGPPFHRRHDAAGQARKHRREHDQSHAHDQDGLQDRCAGTSLAKPPGMAFWVYVLSCEDGSQIVGYTADLDRRLGNVVLGRGNKYSRRSPNPRLEHAEEVESRRAALERVRLIPLAGLRIGEQLHWYDVHRGPGHAQDVAARDAASVPSRGLTSRPRDPDAEANAP